MKPIEKYVQAMENKDFAGLAELFTRDGRICDRLLPTLRLELSIWDTRLRTLFSSPILFSRSAISQAMENKDFAGLAELFTRDGRICDYCTNTSSQKEYHIYGQEAINMFFRNKFMVAVIVVLTLPGATALIRTPLAAQEAETRLTHLARAYGQEAINMFFRNKFGFRQYSIAEAEVVNDTQAEFIANFGGYNVMAIATVREVDESGLIKNLTVRPK